MRARFQLTTVAGFGRRFVGDDGGKRRLYAARCCRWLWTRSTILIRATIRRRSVVVVRRCIAARIRPVSAVCCAVVVVIVGDLTGSFVVVVVCVLVVSRRLRLI